MWVIVAVAGLVIAAVVLNHFVNRDRSLPIERHERALAALRGLAEHPRPVVRDVAPHTELPDEHIRILGDVPPEAARPVRARRPPIPATVARPTIRLPEPAQAADPPPELPGQPAVPAAGPVITLDREARERVRYLAAAAAVLIALVGATAAYSLTDNRSHANSRANTHPPARTAAVTPTTRPFVAPTTTPTTTPIQVARVVALPTGDGSVAATGPFTLLLHATGACWIDVTNGTGQSVFQGTLQPGQDQQVSGIPPLTLRIGNTRAITVAMNGAPLDLTSVANTANLRFQS